MTFYIGAAMPLADSDLSLLSAKHGIEEAALRAVIAVETNGKGFTSSGALTCLYEPHVAYRNTSGTIRNALVKAGIAYQKWGAKPYPKTSYPRIDQCAKIAGEEIACLSTSWGLPQLLGENFKAAGFGSALDMVKAMAVSERNQVEAMIRFITANPKMRDALKAHDWPTFAKLYNGAGYKQNAYDTKLASAYKKAAALVAARLATQPAQDAPKPVPAPSKPQKAQPAPAPAPAVVVKPVVADPGELEQSPAKSKTVWTWLLTAIGAPIAAFGNLDWRVQLAIVAVVVAFAIYGIKRRFDLAKAVKDLKAEIG